MELSSPYPMCPINDRLPVEILGRVFFILRDCPEFPLDKFYIHASHVCRHWRAVALGCPGLWSTIHYRSQLDWIKILLQRSGQVPLKVCIIRDHYSPSNFYEKFHCILQELHRIEEMTLTVASPWVVDDAHEHKMILSAITNGPAPTLRVLRFTGNYTKRLTSSLFSGKSPPNLRYLELTYCRLPLPLHLFTTTLTHLQLQIYEGYGSIDEFMSAISRLSMLQSFIFHNSSTRMSVTARTARIEDHPGPIALPNLAHLDIFGTVHLVAYLLRRLSFPPNACVSIAGDVGTEKYVNDTPQVTVDLLENALWPHLNSVFAHGGNFDTCAIEVPSDPISLPMITLSATRLTDSPVSRNSHPGTERTPCFKVRVRDCRRGAPARNPELCTTVLQRFIRLPSLSDPKTLHAIHHWPFVPQGLYWAEVSSVWKNVGVVMVEGSSLYELADLLAAGHTPPPFPKMFVVTIRGTDLNGAGLPSMDDFATQGRVRHEHGTPVIDRLATTMAQRNANGCLPVSILINECDVTPERVQNLQQELKEGSVVLWDGKERALSEGKERALSEGSETDVESGVVTHFLEQFNFNIDGLDWSDDPDVEPGLDVVV
ncbi:hypothetical protein OF83DRAFT_1284345 [Amylostereum chailletii]|nr:hypothetical protein OF83DRAFT_1284345 [Amylostereum chailletii]